MTHAVDALIDLLEHERTCLLEGRYDDLNAKQEQKEKLLVAVETTEPSEPEIRRLQDRMAEVQALSEAALRGISETRQELERSLQARTRLATYGPGGDARCIEYPQPVLTRRA